MEDWLIRQEMEKEESMRDWLLSDGIQHQQPQKKKMKQMTLETPIIAKKAGKKKSLAEGSTSKERKFNKSGKFTKKEREEVKRTSQNIFDWFNSGTIGSVKLINEEGDPDAPGGPSTRTPRLLKRSE